MHPSAKEKNARLIKAEAHRLGFQFAGISKAEFLEEEAPRLEQWLNQGKHGHMHYMENYFDKRLDPTKLVPGAQSVVTLLYNYYTDKKQSVPDAPKISKYAFGKDYHYVIKDKLKSLLHFINGEIGEVHGRCFVDSAPVMEKAWAQKSGTGWVGKNTNLINKAQGSYFFLSELIIDLPLHPDGPAKDYCGTCTRCIDACPTEAISPYEVDGSKCISYFTIELKDNTIPEKMKGKFDNWMFGCDICQEVCPWNRFSKKHEEPAFEPDEELLSMGRQDWEEITEEVFHELFRKSPVKRAKYEGLKRNILFLKKE